MKGKRVAIIGTGASGIQMIQETGPIASHLTVYQRTPNLCLPMRQKPISADVNAKEKETGGFDRDFAMHLTTFAGFHFDFTQRDPFEDTPEQRRAFFQSLYDEGGFRFWLKTYYDVYHNPKANAEAYHFWRESVLPRISRLDASKQEMLAPAIPPHPFGCKRPSLENGYFEIYNLPHVDLIDIAVDPIESFTETGIVTRSGDRREVDVIALATGFDALTGSLAQLDIRNEKGDTIAQHWQDGLRTSCGLALHGFPNMFFLYGPQAPTAFSNGPSLVQVQARFLDGLMQLMLDQKITRIEPTEEAEVYWTRETKYYWDDSLFPMAKGWWSGGNIPGKRVEPLNYIGGMPKYCQELDESIKNDFQRWHVSAAA